GVRVDDDDARHHVLARRPADAALDVDLGSVAETAAEVAERAFEGDPAPREDADAERMLRARILDRDVGHAQLVEQPAQLEVDLPRRELLRVEARGRAVDLGDPRRLGVRLRQAARVVGDPAPAGYRLHTSTCRSY